MLAQKLISEVIPSVRSDEPGNKALGYMDIFRVSHIPVVDNLQYRGLISDKLIYDLNLAEVPISEHLNNLISAHSHNDMHIFELAIMMHKLKISVLPVLDTEHFYLGAITLYDLARRFADLFSLHEPGAVLILEMNAHDYSVAQISQIVESNNIRILSFFVEKRPGTNAVDVILKLNSEELTEVVQTLTRYDYRIKAIYQDKSVLKDLYQDRYDQFMKYMSI